MYIEKEDIYEIYNIINQKNNNSLNDEELNTFKLDVLDNIYSDFDKLNSLFIKIKANDLEGTWDEIISNVEFQENITKIVNVLAHIESEFGDFYDFHSKFIKHIPDDDSDQTK